MTRLAVLGALIVAVAGGAIAAALAQSIPATPEAAEGWLAILQRWGAGVAFFSLGLNYILGRILVQQIEGRRADAIAASEKLDKVRQDQVADGKAALAVLDKSAQAAIAAAANSRSG